MFTVSLNIDADKLRELAKKNRSKKKRASKAAEAKRVTSQNPEDPGSEPEEQADPEI